MKEQTRETLWPHFLHFVPVGMRPVLDGFLLLLCDTQLLLQLLQLLQERRHLVGLVLGLLLVPSQPVQLGAHLLAFGRVRRLQAGQPLVDRAVFLALKAKRAQKESVWLDQSVSGSFNVPVPYLLVDLSLQLHDLVLHAFVELLEVLHGASFDLQLLQLAPSPHPTDAALQVDDGLQAALVPAAGQPAADALLNDHHLVRPQQLQVERRDKTNERR